MNRRGIGIAALLITALGAQLFAADGAFETTSLLGRKLYALPDDDAVRAARKELSADPKNATLVLKLSKAQAAMRQYREAIATCTGGLKANPNSADLYLERGHRELGLREFKAALPDLTKAVALDPKMLDAQYHQGMAYYFLGNFDEAAKSFKRALDLAKTSDSVIDDTHWLYVALRRAGKTQAAAEALKGITPDVKNKGPHLYFYLRLLHFYQGKLSEKELLPPAPKDANDIEGELSFNTTNYAVGNWHLYNDKDPARANEFFSRVVKGYAWNSWGFIGSEVALAKGKH